MLPAGALYLYVETAMSTSDDRKSDEKASTPPADRKPRKGSTAFPVVGEATVTITRHPPKPADDKHIHRRRPLPIVPQDRDDA
jgi:hypothetical protein